MHKWTAEGFSTYYAGITVKKKIDFGRALTVFFDGSCAVWPATCVLSRGPVRIVVISIVLLIGGSTFHEITPVSSSGQCVAIAKAAV